MASFPFSWEIVLKAVCTNGYYAPLAVRTRLTRMSGLRLWTVPLISLTLISVFTGGFAYWRATTPLATRHLVVSTTTSLYETGLLNVLKSSFESRHQDINVSFISQGTGLAIQTAMHGDADMILVHDPQRELLLLEEGFGVDRKIIAYNFFIIVGPESDPAEVKGLPPLDAMKRIASAGERGQTLWVSRGDESGTHVKEKALWSQAGIDVQSIRQEPWYIEAGTGMTAALKLADEKSAYTLSDMGTYLKNLKDRNIGLEIMVSAGKETLNVYSAILVDPRNSTLREKNFDAAMSFLKHLISEEGQAIIASFGKDQYGVALFNPYTPLLSSNDTEITAWIRQIAFFNSTECPAQYRYMAESLYSET